MAYASAAPAASGNIFSRALDGLFHALVVSAENDARLRRIEVLRGKSDVELAQLGLKRDDIVRHVFGDLYYI